MTEKQEDQLLNLKLEVFPEAKNRNSFAVEGFRSLMMQENIN